MSISSSAQATLISLTSGSAPLSSSLVPGSPPPLNSLEERITRNLKSAFETLEKVRQELLSVIDSPILKEYRELGLSTWSVYDSACARKRSCLSALFHLTANALHRCPPDCRPPLIRALMQKEFPMDIFHRIPGDSEVQPARALINELIKDNSFLGRTFEIRSHFIPPSFLNIAKSHGFMPFICSTFARAEIMPICETCYATESERALMETMIKPTHSKAMLTNFSCAFPAFDLDFEESLTIVDDQRGIALNLKDDLLSTYLLGLGGKWEKQITLASPLKGKVKLTPQPDYIEEAQRFLHFGHETLTKRTAFRAQLHTLLVSTDKLIDDCNSLIMRYLYRPLIVSKPNLKSTH